MLCYVGVPTGIVRWHHTIYAAMDRPMTMRCEDRSVMSTNRLFGWQNKYKLGLGIFYAILLCRHVKGKDAWLEILPLWFKKHVISVCRSGWALSLISGSSLPGRRSAWADMYLIRDRPQMGIYCFSWEYVWHNSTYHIRWHQWRTPGTTTIQQLHGNSLKALWSKWIATDI